MDERQRCTCQGMLASVYEVSLRPGLNVAFNLHAPNQILILVDSNEYVRLIDLNVAMFCRIKLLSASDVF